MTAPSRSVVDTLEKELECSICNNRLENPQKLQKCGHIFCLQCIEDLCRDSPKINDTIVCPECKTRNSFVRPVDKKLLDILRCLQDFNGFTTCEICKVSPQVKDCLRCQKRSCEDCVSTCEVCDERLCESCRGTHGSLLKEEVVDLLDDIIKSRPSEEGKLKVDSALCDLTEARARLEEKRASIDTIIARQTEVLQAAFQAAVDELDEKRKGALSNLHDDELIAEWIEKAQLAKAAADSTNNFDDVLREVIGTKDERKLVNLKARLTGTRNELTNWTTLDENSIPDFSDYPSLVLDHDDASIIESLMPLSKWQREELLILPVDARKIAEDAYLNLKIQMKDFRTSKDPGIVLKATLKQYRDDIAYNAALKIKPKEAVRIWGADAKSGYLQLLLEMAHRAYVDLDAPVYSTGRVFSRLMRTEWWSLVSLEDLVENDYESDSEDD